MRFCAQDARWGYALQILYGYVTFLLNNVLSSLNFVGTVVTLTLSRGANYGYDQRCEVFGTEGLASVKNQPENFSEHADAVGVHRPKWQHSFPQRFEAAFANELNAFADTLLLGTEWPVTEQDCVAVQRVSDAALLSCESGDVVHLEDDKGCGDDIMGVESFASQ